MVHKGVGEGFWLEKKRKNSKNYLLYLCILYKDIKRGSLWNLEKVHWTLPFSKSSGKLIYITYQHQKIIKFKAYSKLL